MKESLGTADMNRNGKPGPAALLPDGIEPRIVDGDQLIVFIFYPQTEIFQSLQPTSSSRNGVIKLSYCFLAEAGIREFRPIDLGKHDETLGIEIFPVGRP